MHRSSPSSPVTRTLAALLICFGGLASIMQLDVPGRVAYAMERGKLEAARSHLHIADLKEVAALERLSEGYAIVSEVSRPSVVYIEAFAARDGSGRGPSVGTGSGVIIDEDGHVMTNNHVIENSDRITVTLVDGRRIDAALIGTDIKTDLALLKIEADRLHPAVLGDSSKVRIGHIVLAIGSPFRLGHSVSHGIISAMGRSDVNVDIDYQNWFQTDAPINPGNSGGPLINTRGEVIGINTAIATENGGHQGVGFAIPSNVVAFIAERLKTDRKVVRGVLGVVIEQITPQMISDYGLDTTMGVLVRNVADNSPAAQAGLKPEDIILNINGAIVTTREQLQEMVAATRPGTKVAMTLWRNRARVSCDVVIGRQPDDFSTSGSVRELNRAWRLPGDERDTVPWNRDELTASESTARHHFDDLGFSASTLTAQLGDRYQLPVSLNRGVVVTRIAASSEAYAARLRPGHVIVEVNDKAVSSVDELRFALSPDGLARGVKLRVESREGAYTVVLQMP